MCCEMELKPSKPKFNLKKVVIPYVLVDYVAVNINLVNCVITLEDSSYGHLDAIKSLLHEDQMCPLITLIPIICHKSSYFNIMHYRRTQRWM
ncbi:Uncharacterized protein TCM_035884 [Theobroma cacao]|uniref:Uncharacterized protein n=1 Tax=Theobroma cacao TaxID=3641 RepID=A0A061FJP1_THECC|nr:Uncharacterized protein TCM_035884 [Theobroma cacao]